MADDDYEVCIVERPEAAPNCRIQHAIKRITYTYDGNPVELATMAREAGERLVRRRMLPIIPAVD